jgi:predicted amidohydrolase
MRVLMVQAAPEPHDVRANLATVLRLLEEHPEADLAVFPELFLTGYTLPGIEALALRPSDAPVRAIREAAARSGTGVVLGYAEAVDGARPANSALAIDERGRVAGVYRKVHLFGDEPKWFTVGESYPVVTLLGRRVGLLICYDVEFPEPARAVALAGAELIVTISANMAPFAGEHDLFARARAVENHVPHVYVNRIGVESGFGFVGGSLAVVPDGAVLAELGAGPVPVTRVVEVPVGVPLDPRRYPDYLGERRPDVPAVLQPTPE